jgi:3-hydroxybutyryl-CoA dehydrogenase
MEIKKVGIVGCGVMGSGIAQVCAQSGYEVVGLEKNDELVNKGLASIDSALSKSVAKGRISEQDKDTVLAHIKGTTNFQDFNDCDLIIEAVVEDIDLKKRVFAELDKICPKHTILATNTSCLSVTDMAMATCRPDKVLGLHFFNPPPVMQLVEIVNTMAVSDETLETGKSFSKSLGKTAVIAPDTPGFIVNRLIVPFVIDAVRMLETGIATKEDIDTAVRLGLNHPMGPLALADLGGIDVLLFMANAMYEELKDPRYAVSPLWRKMVAAGRLGRKRGKGFYDY